MTESTGPDGEAIIHITDIRFFIMIEAGNETSTFTGVENLTLESRLLAVVLMFTLLVAISLLISFYTEIAGKPTEKNMVTGVLLGS